MSFAPRARNGSTQQGAATLFMVLILLFGISLVTIVTFRAAFNQARLSSNLIHADRAAVEADAGLENALAHLKANQSRITLELSGGWDNASSTPHWESCSTSDTAPPCGDGHANQFGSDWFHYGPVPQQLALNNGYTRTSWILSDSIDDPWVDDPDLGCVSVGLTALVPGVTSLLINLVNTLLNLISPGLGLPTSPCLPISFEATPAPIPPSEENPALLIHTRAENPGDARAARAEAQLHVQKASLFTQIPVAALTAQGTVGLGGDFRIWGNPRPPTKPPLDFSLLKLQDIAGLDVTSLLGSYLSGGQAASLAPLLNLTTTEALALDWHVMFPLAVWSKQTTSLNSNPVGVTLLKGARTCLPPFDGTPTSPCTPLSLSISIPAGSIGFLLPLTPVNLPLKLPDIQDPQNLASTATGLLNTSSPPSFPADLFLQTFGVSNANAVKIKDQAVEVISDCSGLPSNKAGLYWVTGNCTLSGAVGKTHGPLILVVEGNLTLSAGMKINGVVFLKGGGTRTVTGPVSGQRPTIRGALLADGNVTGSNQVNLAYDEDLIRRAGYSAGEFAPTPGGWSDKIAGP